MHCTTDTFTIGKFLVERNAINEQPSYQRESAIWSEEKQQLFIDSLFNNYDVPKLYLHDLRFDKGRYDFAIVDGKQRLYAIWQFLDGKIPLAGDFALTTKVVEPVPKPGDKYSSLSNHWKETFKSRTLDVVLIHDATEEDIDELFSRLNNGEPLNAAEKRNAMGGDMCALIRYAAKAAFFRERVSFPNNRYQHLEVAAKLLLITDTEQRGGDPFCDTKKKFLDDFVRKHKRMSESHRTKLNEALDSVLRDMGRVFGKKDQLLRKQVYVPLYFLFVKVVKKEYAHSKLFKLLREFLEWFEAERIANLQRPEEQRDPTLVEFGRLMQQSTNDKHGLLSRVNILRRYLLQRHPDITFRDPKRAFTEDERFAIWFLGKKRCAECATDLRDLTDMEADHREQWAHGGQTKLSNARALCVACNQRLATRIQ